MTDDQSAAELSVGDRDPELAEVLDNGLDGIPGGAEDVNLFKRL